MAWINAITVSISTTSGSTSECCHASYKQFTVGVLVRDALTVRKISIVASEEDGNVDAFGCFVFDENAEIIFKRIVEDSEDHDQHKLPPSNSYFHAGVKIEVLIPEEVRLRAREILCFSTRCREDAHREISLRTMMQGSLKQAEAYEVFFIFPDKKVKSWSMIRFHRRVAETN